ncbi:MAG TPA: hypothetical protein VGB85_14315, partial [Nannocystis sp.]
SINTLVGGAGKTGGAARDWVNSTGQTVPKLTTDQSMAIFTYVYPTYVGYTKDIIRKWGGNWDAYPQKMKEVLVDLRFRGDLSDRHKAHLLPSIKAADYNAFRAAIQNHKYWQDHTNLKNDKKGNINQRITARSAWLTGEAVVAAPAATDWSFPFQNPDGKEIHDAGHYLGSPTLATAALPKALDGYYPIGASGIWHGGIHFDTGSGTQLRQRDGVRCIKDGEVVAYLVNKTYAEIEFKPSPNKALYSTGFTLVRHRLECPAPPPPPPPPAPPAKTAPAKTAPAKPGPPVKPGPPAKTAPAKPAPAPAPTSNVLTFYSLYMHQLDYQGYTEDPKRARPAYWGEPREFVVGEKAKDTQDDAEVLALAAFVEGEPDLLDDCSEDAC